MARAFFTFILFIRFYVLHITYDAGSHQRKAIIIELLTRNFTVGQVYRQERRMRIARRIVLRATMNTDQQSEDDSRLNERQ